MFFLLLEVVVGSGLGTMIRTVDRTGVLLTIAAALGAIVLFAAGTGVLAYLYFSFKKKSISAIKDYYDKKNQGE